VSDVREEEPSTVRGNRSQKATSVDQEYREVPGRKDDGPPRDKDEEAESVADGIVGVASVTGVLLVSVLLDLPSIRLHPDLLVVTANCEASAPVLLWRVQQHDHNSPR
jgi:hypothetical protein